jgi:transposase-like protein
MKKYQILRWKNNGRMKEIAQRTAALRVPVIDLVAAAQDGMRDLADRMGLELMRLAVEHERMNLTEGPERVGYKWGSQPGYAFWNGRKIALVNQRVRTLNREREIPLRSYAKFQEDGAQGRIALREMLRGVSTRDYREGVEGLLRGYGIEKSSISRQFIRASERKLRELMERDLRALNLAVLFIDGIGFAGHLLVVAVGVDEQGTKHPLGLWQGATENATVCQALLDDLIRRGLDPEKRHLFVIDGGKGLRRAIERTFGERGEVQRCQEHKKRNVAEHLPPHRQAEFRGRMNAAYAMMDYGEAKTALLDCARDLERMNPSAAASLKEGLEDTLTLHRLGVPAALRKSLSTTNPIESPFAYVRQKTSRVKRWRDGSQAQRWAACALLKAGKTWRKVKGYMLMPQLLEALCRREIGQKG